MITNSLRKIRLSKGFTQSELAEKCSVSKNAISDIERGIYVPRLDLAFRLSEALGCSLYELFRHWTVVKVPKKR